MLKRGSVFFILFLTLPISYAIFETSIFSGTVEHGENISADGTIFTIKYDYFSKKADVRTGGLALIIQESTCEIRDNFDICIGEFEFVRREPITIFDVYESEVNIFKITSNLEIEHEIENSELLLEEESEVTLTLENTGDIPVTELNVVISIPEGISLIETDGCDITGNSVTINGRVNPHDITTCVYTIAGTISGVYDLKANISHNDGVETITETSTEAVEIQNKSLEITVESNFSKLDLGDSTELNVILKNKHSEYDVKVKSFTVPIPQGTALIKSSNNFQTRTGTLKWSGTLEPGDVENFTIAVGARRVEDITLDLDLKYEIESFDREENVKIDVPVECDCPYIEQNIFGNTMELILINLNENLTFKNFDFSIPSVGLEKKVNALTPKQHAVLGKIPYDGDPINSKLIYETKYQEKIIQNIELGVFEIEEEESDGNESVVEQSETQEESKEETEEEEVPEEILGSQENAESENSLLEPQTTEVELERFGNPISKTQLSKGVSSKAIMLGGLMFGVMLILGLVLYLRKRHHFGADDKTIKEIEAAIQRMEKKKK